MSEKLIAPAKPPLPAPWYLPFHVEVGSHTSKKFAGSKTARTRQIGASIVPTGDGCEPATSDSTRMIEVSGSPSVWNVATAHGALAAAVAAGNAASAANKAYLRMRPTPLVKIGNFFSSVLWQILPPFGKFGKDEDWERRLGISGRRADRPRRPCESASPSAPGPRVRVTALGRMQAFIVSKNPAVPERAAIATRIISTCWPPARKRPVQR